ncbi:MAG: helix-turn-helix transcriptional regulator [Solirubrobacterales bacterium]
MAEVARIGQEIKRRREESERSLSQLADDAGISKGYLWKLEKGDVEARPSANTLYKISRALGTSMSTLMGKAILIEEPTDLPPSLVEFAEKEGLGERDRAMLAQINFRGKQPERPEDWSFIWNAIKRSIPDRVRRRGKASG